MSVKVQINRRALMAEISNQDAQIKREADKIIKQEVLERAVAAMQKDFEKHPVTKEIARGIEPEI